MALYLDKYKAALYLDPGSRYKAALYLDKYKAALYLDPALAKSKCRFFLSD